MNMDIVKTPELLIAIADESYGLKLKPIEAEIMLKSTSPKMQEADRACAYELINDSCIHESAEVRAYQAGLLPLRKEYPEQCHPSNKLVEAFKQYSRACWELL